MDKCFFFFFFFDRLAELHLSKNGYTSVDLQTQCESLCSLHFNDNPIVDPTHLALLGHAFPRLNTLIAQNLPLTSLLMSGESKTLPSTFHTLECLSLSRSSLSQWDDIAVLSVFTSLCKLRLMGIPLLDEIEEEKQRGFLIACLPNIHCLNGSDVSSEERKAAERMVIRHYQSCDPTERPMPFRNLLQRHGELNPLAEVCLDPEKVVELNVKFEDLPTVKRKVDVTMTTGQLKRQLSSDVVGLAPSKFRLYYIDIEGESAVYGAEEMRYMSRKLFSYRMKNNDQIIVQLKDSS